MSFFTLPGRGTKLARPQKSRISCFPPGFRHVLVLRRQNSNEPKRPERPCCPRTDLKRIMFLESFHSPGPPNTEKKTAQIPHFSLLCAIAARCGGRQPKCISEMSPERPCCPRQGLKGIIFLSFSTLHVHGTTVGAQTAKIAQFRKSAFGVQNRRKLSC